MRYIFIILVLFATSLCGETNQNVVKFFHFNLFLSDTGYITESKAVVTEKKKDEKTGRETTFLKTIQTKKNTSSTNKKKEVRLSEEEQIFQSGLGLFNESNYRVAEDIFIDLLQKYPDTKLKFAATYYLAEIKLNTGKSEEAMMYYNKIIQEYPENEFTPKTYYRISGLFFNNNDLTNSLKYLTLLEQRYPKDKSTTPESYVFKGKVYIALKEYDHAISSYETVIKKYPDSPSVADAYFSLAEIYEKQPEVRDMEKSLENYQKVTDQFPASPFCSRAQKRVKFIKENFLEYK